LPRMKTLDEFDFSKAPQIQATKIHELAQGGYIERAEPIILIGDCGTGKTHLLTGLCVAACRQKRRVRFATAAALVNELVEAKQQLQLRRVLARWERYDLIAIDEVGYVPMADPWSRVPLPGHRRTSREGHRHHHHESALFRMDPGGPQRSFVQGAVGPHQRSGAHHRNRCRQLPLPAIRRER
jgi:IstB-like ATP binding protein